MTDVIELTTLEQAALVRSREISPVDLVTAYLERIDRIDPKINSFITVASEQAIAAAKEAERATLTDDGLPAFHGVPIAVKDVLDSAGIRTTYGSGGWADRVPTTDCAAVAKARAAGFIILGKTNTPEFSAGVTTEPVAYGPCHNPWNTNRSSGGSSGGSAAAVAAGLAPIAIGTDDGGSIRIPSSWCGLVGVKPSRGRVSNAPAPSALELTAGPMARTVADAAALLDALSGYVTGDAFWAPPPQRPYLEETTRDPGRLKVRVTTTGADDVTVDPVNIAAVIAAAELLAELGHDVEEVSDWPGRGTFPDERGLSLPVMYGVKYAALGRLGEMPPAETLEPVNGFLIDAGEAASAVDLWLGSWYAAHESRRVVAGFDDIDVMLTPVMACTAPPLGLFSTDPQAAMELLRAVQWTAQFSVSGQPAIAFPWSHDSNGVAVGVQLVGKPADEATLFRLAAQLEATGGQFARPAIA